MKKWLDWLADRKHRDVLFSHIWYFSEHLSVYCAAFVKKYPDIELSLQNSILDVRRYLLSDEGRWSERSDVIFLSAQMDLLPEIDAEIINEICETLLSPAELVSINASESDDEIELRGTANLPRLPRPDRLWEYFWLYNLHGRASFSTINALPNSVAVLREKAGFFWEEPISPLALLQTFLVDRLGVEGTAAANSLIQRWLRGKFHFRYTSDFKYSLKLLATLFNDTFFSGEQHIARDNVPRSATVGVLPLVKLIGNKLDFIACFLRNSKTISAPKEMLGLGAYCFLRFCGLLRVRYQWFPEDLPGAAGQSQRVHQCASALRHAEYSFLAVRIFGSLSAIEGFNFIFRGGLLPRTSSGRSLVVQGPPGSGKTLFALQKLSGVAARGGIGIYFSFEETRELLVDRLVSFDMNSTKKFKVLESEADLDAYLSSPHRTCKGALLLYGTPGGGDFNLLDSLSSLNKKVRRIFSWRAVVIDSINALGLAGQERNFEGDRRALNELINIIEQNKMLGIVLSETGAKRFGDLPYLADTWIDLGFDDNRVGRYIEIKKCRSQGFQSGSHPFRIVDDRGIKIYPSLAAIRSALRRKTRTTLSQERSICITEDESIDLPFYFDEISIADKSTTLIEGSGSTGKTLFALLLATSAAVKRESGGDPQAPTGILVVTFRTPETRLRQMIQSHKQLFSRWKRLNTTVRWFSPGDNFSSEQVVARLRVLIKAARRQGRPIERIVFDEVDSADHMLPHIRREPLFWTTILQLLSAEAITGFFVFETNDAGVDSSLASLRSGIDYQLEIVTHDGGKQSYLRTKKVPDMRFEDNYSEIMNEPSTEEIGPEEEEIGPRDM